MGTRGLSSTSISIILPAHNEERRITAGLEKILQFCQTKDWDFEIIVVEDGSTDHTIRIVNKFRTQDNRIRLLSLPCRLGKGGSIVVAGLSAISKNLVSYMDVDSEPSELEKLIEHIGGSDVVLGSRILRGELTRVKRPFHRAIFSFLYSKAFRVLFRIPVYDPQCGLKLFRSELVPKLFGEIDTIGFAFDSEVIVRASSLGLKLKEVPINWSHVGSSTLSVLTEIRSMGLDLLAIWYKYHCLWQEGKATYVQKKGTVYGRCLFKLLSVSELIKSRHLRNPDYKDFVSNPLVAQPQNNTLL